MYTWHARAVVTHNSLPPAHLGQCSILELIVQLHNSCQWRKQGQQHLFYNPCSPLIIEACLFSSSRRATNQWRTPCDWWAPIRKWTWTLPPSFPKVSALSDQKTQPQSTSLYIYTLFKCFEFVMLIALEEVIFCDQGLQMTRLLYQLSLSLIYIHFPEWLVTTWRRRGVN